MHDLVLALATQWWSNLNSDLGRYALFATGTWFLLWIALARILRHRKIRPRSPPPRQLAVEFLVSLRSVAVFSTLSLVPFLLERAGWLQGHAIATARGTLWFWGSLAAMIVVHDAYFYWVHRAIHLRRLFRRLHCRHHRSHNPSPFTAYSFDLGEAAAMGVFVPLWVVLVPTSWEVVGLFVLHQIVRNTLGHCGYELMPARRDGRPLLDWLTTTTHHDLHHAHGGYNYGLYFSWWDRWMGTEHPAYHARFAQAAGRRQTGEASRATG